MKYEDMSDFEINKAVAVKLGYAVLESFRWEDEQCWVKAVMGSGPAKIFDYTASPSDAWPIIVENGISVMMTSGSCGDLWTCGVANFHDGSWDFDNEKTGEYVDFETYGDNPLRAAMICFLKMKDAQK